MRQSKWWQNCQQDELSLYHLQKKKKMCCLNYIIWSQIINITKHQQNYI